MHVGFGDAEFGLAFADFFSVLKMGYGANAVFVFFFFDEFAVFEIAPGFLLKTDIIFAFWLVIDVVDFGFFDP